LDAGLDAIGKRKGRVDGRELAKGTECGVVVLAVGKGDDGEVILGDSWIGRDSEVGAKVGSSDGRIGYDSEGGIGIDRGDLELLVSSIVMARRGARERVRSIEAARAKGETSVWERISRPLRRTKREMMEESEGREWGEERRVRRER
jgi:hypothetical protein